MTPTTERVLDLARQAGVLRPRDLERRGIARVYLQRLVERGLLQRVGRGLYVLAEAEPDPHQTLAEACTRVPKGVVCLLSALRFHGLTTQNPFEVWLALPVTARRPKLDRPVVRVVRMSGASLSSGVEEHRTRAGTVRVYSAAKTVADCFKFRNKVGLDVAIEALRDYCRRFRGRLDELWHFARICRVDRVMRPYLEALA